MTDSTDQGGTEETGAWLSSPSRRTLLGLVLALWSTGSISDAQAARLLYGTQGYGRFGYGGEAPADLEGTEAPGETEGTEE
jgi:hypothetical protein